MMPERSVNGQENKASSTALFEGWEELLDIYDLTEWYLFKPIYG
jgi:hypothetical protein